MCTLLIAWQVGPALVVAANRDEFYARPAAPAQFWADAPDLLAGRDLAAGGTWLGVTRDGRFAAVTNLREPGVAVPPGAPSRGALVAGFLRGALDPGDYVAALEPRRYAGFNLVVADSRELWYVGSRSAPRRLPPGVHGVSNAPLGASWPKVVRGTARLAALVEAGAAAPDALLALLADTTPADDAALPDTGVGLAMERTLSPLFIAGPVYGTCCSTAVVVDAGRVDFCERTTRPPGPGPEVREAFLLRSPGR
jgi:uncharacterized protein with NRDE domain